MLRIIVLAFLLSSCASMTKVEQEQKRAQLDLMAKESVATLLKQQPELKQQLDDAVGYAVGDIKFTKVPVIGFGGGQGVLIDSERDETRYLKIKRFDLGGGIAARSYKTLLVFPEREEFKQFKDGQTLYSAGAEGSAGASTKNIDAGARQVYLLADGGVSATATARAMKVSIDTKLTPMAESESSYPTLHGNLETDGVTSEEPRVWDHKLPFFAQDVVDMGFDLPLPYGIGITYAHIDQELLLTDLEVGFNGGGTKPIAFVDFDNASAKNDTVQLMADAWVLPFMNVFAILGAIDGNAPLEFTIDGDNALEQSGTDCSKPIINPPLCVIQGRQITVPIDANYHGTNVGIGTVIAGGWGDYFVAIPITYVVSDIDIADTLIDTINVAPRIGKIFDLHDKGKLSVYLGGSYIDVEMDITGSVPIPGGGGNLDYKIHQENKDKWNALIGENWDISKHWSWTAEIGFAGSREHFISALTRRY